MANSIAYVKNYTSILDEAYKRAACSTCLNSPRRMARAGRNAKEIRVPKIEVTGLGDYTRNVGYKTGNITYEFETKTFNYDRGIKLLADVMDVEEAEVLNCFVAADSKLQRTQVAPETDTLTFAEIVGRDGVTHASRFLPIAAHPLRHLRTCNLDNEPLSKLQLCRHSQFPPRQITIKLAFAANAQRSDFCPSFPK